MLNNKYRKNVRILIDKKYTLDIMPSGQFMQIEGNTGSARKIESIYDRLTKKVSVRLIDGSVITISAIDGILSSDGHTIEPVK